MTFNEYNFFGIGGSSNTTQPQFDPKFEANSIALKFFESSPPTIERTKTRWEQEAERVLSENLDLWKKLAAS